MQKNFKYEIICGNKDAVLNVNKRDTDNFIYLDLNFKLNNEIPQKTVLKCVVPATNALAIWSSIVFILFICL